MQKIMDLWLTKKKKKKRDFKLYFDIQWKRDSSTVVVLSEAQCKHGFWSLKWCFEIKFEQSYNRCFDPNKGAYACPKRRNERIQLFLSSVLTKHFLASQSITINLSIRFMQVNMMWNIWIVQNLSFKDNWMPRAVKGDR